MIVNDCEQTRTDWAAKARFEAVHKFSVYFVYARMNVVYFRVLDPCTVRVISCLPCTGIGMGGRQAVNGGGKGEGPSSKSEVRSSNDEKREERLAT